jgi:hypothetical protein
MKTSKFAVGDRIKYPKTKDPNCNEYYYGTVKEIFPNNHYKIVFDLHPRKWISLPESSLLPA